MLGYEKLTASDGAVYLQNVWNLLFKPLTEASFFIEPWHSGVPNDCVAFRLNPTKNAVSKIYFCVSNHETLDFLKRTRGEIYLYGAYNQIIVCQMRARGSVDCEEKNPEAEKIKECLRAQARRKATKNSVVDKLSREELAERLKILDEGELFCFRPKSYAYATYERG